MARVLPLALLGLWALIALLGPCLALEPNRVDMPAILAPPSAGSWLGNDDLGRPVLDRLLLGARTSFVVGIGVVAVLGVLTRTVLAVLKLTVLRGGGSRTVHEIYAPDGVR